MELYKLKEISIKSVLSNFGIEPQKINRNQAWYYAIDRIEKTASFKVDLKKNRFFDFGTFQGGTVIDIVMKLKKCNFKDAVVFLEEKESINFPTIKTNQVVKVVESKFRIIKVSKLENSNLLYYLSERNIDPTIAKKYCCQLFYEVNLKKYNAIGFQNDLKGFEIRNPFFKGGNSPKTITTIRNKSKQLIVFEGFMDFLSYATLLPIKHLKYDFIILNSISFYKKIDQSIIDYYELIFLFLDNDNTGKKAVKELQKTSKKIKDFSFKYENFNDFNDYLINKPIL